MTRFFRGSIFLIGLKMLNLMIQFLNLFEKLRRAKKIIISPPQAQIKGETNYLFCVFFFPREIKSTKKDIAREMSGIEEDCCL